MPSAELGRKWEGHFRVVIFGSPTLDKAVQLQLCGPAHMNASRCPTSPWGNSPQLFRGLPLWKSAADSAASSGGLLRCQLNRLSKTAARAVAPPRKERKWKGRPTKKSQKIFQSDERSTKRRRIYSTNPEIRNSRYVS